MDFRLALGSAVPVVALPVFKVSPPNRPPDPGALGAFWPPPNSDMSGLVDLLALLAARKMIYKRQQ